ncbi:MAG TPA: response regulator transcription factor, partial [Gemmataceae bacterium]|nr:response regulator transcription factor [Gemmataceae bacterium]
MSASLNSASSDTQSECSQEKRSMAPAPAGRGRVHRILIAEDDRISRRMLKNILVDWGFDVVAACDGLEAWQILQSKDAPRLAILDWLMPGMDGLDICRQARALAKHDPLYLILLTVKTKREDIVTGLRSGADDYMTKPFDLAELEARLQVAKRILDLQSDLAVRVSQLEAAISQVQELEGLLPICMYCKKIRNDKNSWEQMESYISAHSKANFSHGLCPSCYEKV